MQLSPSSSIDEVAAIVSDRLASAEITPVLCGGTAVQIDTSGLYESRDLDFVESGGQQELERVLNLLGFLPGTRRGLMRRSWLQHSRSLMATRLHDGQRGRRTPMIIGSSRTV